MEHGTNDKCCGKCRQGFRHFGLRNQQGEYEHTGKKYMSYAKMCVSGSCDTREGLNKSLVDKTVPKKGETVLGLFEGTVPSAAELLWIRAAGWNVDPAKIIPLQKVHSETISYRGQVKSRGKPPRDDRLTEAENETERQRRLREENEARRAEKDLEKVRKDVEKEMSKRPTQRKEGRKVKKLGKVIREQETRLEQALEMETTAHVDLFVKKECLIVTLEEAGDLMDARMGGRYRVTIDESPRCDEGCREYMEMRGKSSGTWVHCRHVYAVLRAGLRVFQNTDGEKGVPLIHQPTFSEKEVRSILSIGLDLRALGGELFEFRSD